MQVLQVEQKNSAGFDIFRAFNLAISRITNHTCSLKPDASILIELYCAEKQGKALTVSTVGLTVGVPQATALRYLKLLEERGWITRSRHRSDQRVVYVRIAPMVYNAFDSIFDNQAFTASASYTPAL